MPDRPAFSDLDPVGQIEFYKAMRSAMMDHCSGTRSSPSSTSSMASGCRTRTPVSSSRPPCWAAWSRWSATSLQARRAARSTWVLCTRKIVRADALEPRARSRLRTELLHMVAQAQSASVTSSALSRGSPAAVSSRRANRWRIKSQRQVITSLTGSPGV
jgi:hypothetical protein